MAEKSGCNHLECTQCNESFLSAKSFEDMSLSEKDLKDAQEKLRKHYGSKEHLAKVPLYCNLCKKELVTEADLRKHYDSDEHVQRVRKKSENKTLGDLNTFTSEILDKVCLPSPKHPSPPLGLTAATMEMEGSEYTQARLLPHSDHLSLPPADEFGGAGSTHDDFLWNLPSFPDEVLPGRDNETILRDEIRELKEENRKLREQLKEEKVGTGLSPEDQQNILLGLRENEMGYGYEFPSDKFYRLMYVLMQNYNSVWELVEKILLCFVTVNRKCGNYGGRPNKRGVEEEEKPKKRKKTE